VDVHYGAIHFSLQPAKIQHPLFAMFSSPLRATFALLLTGFASLHAEVRLASPFTDHMVLQREMKVPVWGAAAPGEKVTVDFGGDTESTIAGADGKWRVNLPAMTASDQGRVFTVTGSATAQPIKLSDVLVGEVWLASGQSNMDFSMSKKVKYFAGVANEDQEIAAANYPGIRILTGSATKTYAPQDHVDGQWEICSPQTAPAFSAVSYFFARDLQKEIKVPVGIITMSFGASTAESWIPREALNADPQLSPMVARFDAAVQKWKSMPHPSPGPTRSEDISAPVAAVSSVATPVPVASASPVEPASPAGSPVALASARPRARRPRAPGDPVQDQHNATVLFNGMINPIIPYAIRGAIWYQGESIVGGEPGRALYPRVQDTLINDWRKLWGEGDFPFYIVQLAALQNASNGPTTREAQATVLHLKNTGMAVTTDIGDPKNVHPKDKQDVGDRLCRIALANVYGRQIEYSGPLYQSSQVENGAMRIHFTHIGGGLVAKGGTPLKWFTIAGADGKFAPADAKIDGDTVVVSSPAVAAPVAVRYAWDPYPADANLFNAAGLPAAPFRTDAPVPNEVVGN
jgi:sialate O-acetylesterase